MNAQEQIEITMGTVRPWRDLELAIKGFSGVAGQEYAKVIVRRGDESEVVRIGLGEVARLTPSVTVRLDEVPPPSKGSGPAPTGRGRVVLSVVDGADPDGSR